MKIAGKKTEKGASRELSRKRKSAKEVHTAKLQIQQAMLASAAVVVTAPPVMMWSATMPAYCYTPACPVHSLREPIRRRGGGAVGQEDIGAIHRRL